MTKITIGKGKLPRIEIPGAKKTSTVYLNEPVFRATWENAIEEYKGNDWTGLGWAFIAGLITAVIIVDVLSGYQLHYWIAELVY